MKSFNLRKMLGIVATLAFFCSGFESAHAGDARLGKMKADRILILGNSMTTCGSNQWGLSASTADKDYAHLLTKSIDEATGGSLVLEQTSPTPDRWYNGNPLPNYNGNVINVADIFERNYKTWDNARIKNQLEWKADIVVLQFGENVPMNDFDAEAFALAMNQLVAELKLRSNPQIFIVSHVLGRNPTIDNIKKQIVAEDPSHRVYVDLTQIQEDPSNMGQYAHPNDKGMKLMTEGIFKAMEMHAAETGTSDRCNYVRPFEPPTRPVFIALPPGAVEPAGWLRDWCLAARDGYTGHMDEYDDAFKHAWASDYQMTGEGLFWYKGAWPYEGGGYWFDGLARLGYALHDDALIQMAKRRLYAVADHTNANGIFFLWWLDRNNPDDRKAVAAALDGWPVWACGLLGRAMVGYYAGSGDKHVLDSLETVYSADPDCLREITGSMSNLWPAFDTYTWTGNKSIAAALDAMFDQKRAGLTPILNRYRTAPDLTPGTEVENQHVVAFLENTTPWAVGYLWTGDSGYLEAALGWHDLIERVAMQPYGVPVSDEWYCPTGAFRGSETCDVAGYVWSQAALLAVSGEGHMADRLERAFFNAGPATVSRDFKTHVYFQSPNRFADGSPNFPHGPMAGGGSYRPKHSPLCCTAALNRIVPYYVTNMWVATYDNGLAATCYGPCKVTALAADRVPVEITCKTDYPFNETIHMSVQPAKEAAFPLLLHIPAWCKNPELSINGSVVNVQQNAQGFVCVNRSWKPGDTVRLCFPMTALVQTGRDNSQYGPYTGEHKPTMVKIPKEGSTQGSPYATVSYGPLLFSLAIPDTKDSNTPEPSARWAFALDVQNPDITVERRAMPSRWDWPLDSPLKLTVNAAAIDWTPAPALPKLPDTPVTKQKEASEKITLIPYGCTKFRISMFPVTANTEASESH